VALGVVGVVLRAAPPHLLLLLWPVLLLLVLLLVLLVRRGWPLVRRASTRPLLVGRRRRARGPGGGRARRPRRRPAGRPAKPRLAGRKVPTLLRLGRPRLLLLRPLLLLLVPGPVRRPTRRGQLGRGRPLPATAAAPPRGGRGELGGATPPLGWLRLARWRRSGGRRCGRRRGRGGRGPLPTAALAHGGRLLAEGVLRLLGAAAAVARRAWEEWEKRRA